MKPELSRRKLIAADPVLMQKVVQGMVQTIHLFKTQPGIAVPLLQRFLQIDDRKIAEDLHAYYVPLFPRLPRVNLGETGMKTLRDHLIQKYPAAARLQESDVVDSSFVDQLEQSGFIQRLYAGDKS
jgi:hypothetical protein